MSSLSSPSPLAMATEEDREAAFWLAFSRVPHIGPARLDRLVQRFDALSLAWEAPADELRAVLEPRPLSELMAMRDRADPVSELKRVQALGIRVLHAGHSSYPRLLKEISGRPAVLYVRGDLTPEDDVAVGVVGTRRSTPYGRQVAEQVSGDLGQAGITVVSGLARGVDAAAHRGALEAGGRTIAILGSGVDVIYPAEHRQLADRILQAGAIVSEQPPGAKPDAQNFPARNRIISGVSLGVVVVEAPARSGTLITASFAGDQGREVFVVPGNVHGPNSEGSNQLLRDGARLVRNGQDVLEDLGLGQRGASLAQQPELLLDGEEARLFAVIGDDPRHIDELAEAVGLPTSAVGALLLPMELRGLVRNHGAQFYVRR